MCEEVHKNPLALAIGNFDGVHIGHRALLEAVRRAVASLRDELPGLCAGVWCFAEPPSAYLADKPIPQILSIEEKLACFAEAGMDYCILGDFPTLRDYSPDRFVQEILLDVCDCRYVVCGFNFSFGARGLGNAEILRRFFGDRMTVVDPVCLGAQVVSSTAIRAAIGAGNVELTKNMLGRPWSVCLPVQHGKALGRTIGVPTLNQHFTRGSIIPAFGVYATVCEIDGVHYPAVTNVGIRPTVDDGDTVTCESHILDFSQDMYDRAVRVHFHAHLRTEQKYASLDELRAAIADDITAARAYFKLR